MTTPSDQLPSPQQRIAAYWNVLKNHKERKTVREILEREVLFSFITTNKSRINEFPLLETQQQAIVDFLSSRVLGDPLHEHTASLLSFFINQLGKYGTLLSAGDTPGAEGEVPGLLNHESLLLKAVQSVVYTTSLAVDNFTEILIRYYGEQALGPIDAIMEKVELGEQFWKESFDHFITTLVDCAYREITANQLYTVRKEKSQLILRFGFDDIVSRLKHTDKQVEKTRAQMMYEQGATFEIRKARKLVAEHLARLSAKPEYPFNPADISHIAHVVCMDPAGVSFPAAAGLLASAAEIEAVDAEGKAMTQESARFIMEQVLTMACSSAVALNAMRQDLLKSLQMFESREAAYIMNQVGVFDMIALERTLYTMLEYQFLAILRQRAGEDIGKMQIRSTRLRRVREEDLAPLVDMGLNRIRKNKLWLKDPDGNGTLLFARQNQAEFLELVQLMQLEPPLAREVFSLWQRAGFKVVFSLHLNLDLIARTTTNLNQRLSEIFIRLGTLGPGKRPAA